MPAAIHGSAQHLIELASSRANRIYVAGPMTGYPDFNFPAFNAVAATMRAEGWHVENPAEHGIVDSAEWADYLRYDLGRLATCEAIMLLPGWSKSKGANLEVTIARQLGMPIMLAEGAESAEQPHPEPIAWMVGTAFWWTKEEAERDAAATGLSIVGLGPMTDTAEVERLESRVKTQRESIRSHVQEVDRLRLLEIKYGLKIEERNELLRKCLEWITSARDGVLYPISRDFEGVVGRNAEGLGQATPALIDAIDAALSTSAEPSAPVEHDHDALVAAVCVLRSQGLGNLSEAVEAARAALERKQ